MSKSKQKGKRGEYEAAEVLSSMGIPASRGHNKDIECGIPIHFEVKRRERLNVGLAYDQASRDAGENVPVVLWRPNRRPWMVTLALEDVPRLIETWPP